MNVPKSAFWFGAAGLAASAILACRLGIGRAPVIWGVLDDAALGLSILTVALIATLLPRALSTLLTGLLTLSVIVLGVINVWYFKFYRGYVTLRTYYMIKDLGGAEHSAKEFASVFDLSLVSVIFLTGLLLFHIAPRPNGRDRIKGVLIACGLVAACAYGRSWNSTRFFSVLAENSVMYLWREQRDLWVHRARSAQLREEAARGRDLLLPPTPGLRRPLPQYPFYSEPVTLKRPDVKKNVIVVMLESVHALDMGLYGAEKTVTPNLDQIGREGFWAKRFYSSTSQTVRAEFAVNCSQMDFEEGATLALSDSPFSARCLPTILASEGYATYWIHGFRLSFYKRDQLLPKLGFQRVIAEPDFAWTRPEQRAGWGAKDEVVLEHAVRILEKETRPFYAEIMTLTNHHPFDHNYGVEFPDYLQRTKYLYHRWQRGMYYTDYAVGHFMQVLRASPLSQNTIVVFVGDHSLFSYDPEKEEKMNEFEKNEQYYRVPFVATGPGVPTGPVDGSYSQVDIAPTILEWLGYALPTSFFGHPMGGPPDGRLVYSHTSGGSSVRMGDVTCIPVDNTCYSDRFPYCREGQSPTWGRSCIRTKVDPLTHALDASVAEVVSMPNEDLVDALLDYQQFALGEGLLAPLSKSPGP